MKSIKILNLGLVMFLSVFLIGCKKEGCTNPNAANYNSEAKTNDGSCIYEGSTVLWFEETTYNALIDDGATSLTLYVNNEPLNSISIDGFWTQSPQCGEDGCLTFSKGLGSSESSLVNFSVVDQTGFEYWSGEITLSGNQCVSHKLVF